MTPERADPRADALLRLERTRLQWALRSARNASPSGHLNAGSDELAAGSALNGILTDWLVSEISARLWPDTSETAPVAPRDGATQVDAGERPPLPSQLLTESLAEWTHRHPWLSVLGGLLAGSLAASQRQRLLQWAISAALPWLASNASVLAAPLLAQWLNRQPVQGPSAPSTDHEEAPSDPPVDAPSTGQGDPGATELNASRSAA